MINLNSKKPDSAPIPFSKILLKSTIFALIISVPAIGIFLGIYYSTENLLLGAILGFGFHFVMLAFSGRISNWLVKILN